METFSESGDAEASRAQAAILEGRYQDAAEEMSRWIEARKNDRLTATFMKIDALIETFPSSDSANEAKKFLAYQLWTFADQHLGDASTSNRSFVKGNASTWMMSASVGLKRWADAETYYQQAVSELQKFQPNSEQLNRADMLMLISSGFLRLHSTGQKPSVHCMAEIGTLAGSRRRPAPHASDAADL